MIDYKTAVRAKRPEAVHQDLQLLRRAYLLTSNKFTFPTAPVRCRMDVIRKLKVPAMEFYSTVRTAQDRKRFAKIANGVLRGIDQGVFIPNRSYLLLRLFLYPRMRIVVILPPIHSLHPIFHADADRYQMLTQEMMFLLKTVSWKKNTKPVSVKCQLSATAFFR